MNNVEKSILLKKELDQLRPLKKEDELRIMQKFRLDWNYHSNHLEGNSLTFRETKALILFGITAQGKPLKDHFEVTGHNEAVKWVLQVVKEDRPLTENFIRELHELILKEPYEVDAITPDGQPTKKRVRVGEYKNTPNHVKTETGEIFRFATPEETPAKMNDLVNDFRTKSKDPNVNPILLAAEFHYRFIRIHPFDDGNGRTARILMNFILLKFGYPPVIIKTEEKETYFSALRQADAGLLEAFVEYIGINLVRSLEIMIRGAKGEDIEEPEDWEKEMALLDQKLRTLNRDRENKDSRLEELKRDVYLLSIVPTSEILKIKGGLFDKYYSSSNFFFGLTYLDELVKTIKPDDFELDLIKESSTSFILGYSYSGFQSRGIQPFSHDSRIQFLFSSEGYITHNSGNKILVEKLYGEPLTEKEINQLVNTELKRHTKFIEEKLNTTQEN